MFLKILKTILFGIVEGITEWLPVSSTGHLKLFNTFCPLPFSAEFMEMFEYVIQLFATLAVVILFWKKIFPLKKSEEKKSLVWDTDVLRTWLKIIVACVPALSAVLIDKLLEPIQGTLTETLLISITLVLYGVLFIVVERALKNKELKINSVAELTVKTAFFIGLSQVLAVIPGTSRSGVTILAALLLSTSRETAAEFTFLLAIPTMIGTSGYKILKFILSGASVSSSEIWLLVLGCAVAFVVSLLTVRLLMSFVKKHRFTPFGYYRIALGVIVLCAVVLPAVL